jgi:hypothetical protein
MAGIGEAGAGTPAGIAAGIALPAIALRRAAKGGRMGALEGIMPPRAGMAEGIASGAALGKPPICIFFSTLPPVFSLSSTDGSVVIIFTIGLN